MKNLIWLFTWPRLFQAMKLYNKICKSLPARIRCARQCGEVGKVLGIQPSQGVDRSRRGIMCAVHHHSLDTKAKWTPKPNIVHTAFCNIFRLIRLVEVYQPESDAHACMDTHTDLCIINRLINLFW